MKLRRIEIALILGLIAALLVGGANARSEELADKVIRLHVVANSDSDEDQALKLLVRDKVLEFTSELEGSRDEAVDELNMKLDNIQTVIQDYVYDLGYSYPVTVSLGVEDFETREYESFSLPAGEYMSLRVIIGQGEGKNWWCVIFPPICMTSCSEELSVQAMAAGLDDGDIALITGENQVYVFKFKLVELVQSVKMRYNK